MKNGPYELVVAPPDYPGKKYRGRYIYEHHLVWWKKTKTIVTKGFMIHHKNDKKRDNRFSNLELIPQNEHGRRHGRGAELVRLKCDECSTHFMRAARNVKCKVRQGQERFFCCRSHQVIYQQRKLWGKSH